MTDRLIPDGDRLLADDYVHLQTGGVGSMPRPVFQAMAAAAAALEKDPVGETYGPGIGRLDQVRGKAASLLGCERDDVVLTGSTTAGMFLLAQGLKLKAGDRILITDHEHPGGELGWEWASRRFGLVLDRVAIAPGEADHEAIVRRFAAAMRPGTRVLSFSHILFTTGVRLPAARLALLARDHDCLCIVDGAQAIGALPLDMAALGCDAYAASGHKWLMGPKGTGLLYLRPGLEERLDALPLAAGRGANSDSTGIGNIPGMHGLGAAIDYVERLGPARIEAHNMALRDELYDALKALSGIDIPQPRSAPTASANLSFALPAGSDPHAVRRNLLLRHKIRLRVVERAGFIGLRASLHCHNNSGDIAALVAALGREIGG